MSSSQEICKGQNQNFQLKSFVLSHICLLLYYILTYRNIGKGIYFYVYAAGVAVLRDL